MTPRSLVFHGLVPAALAACFFTPLRADTITLNYTNTAVFDTQISGPGDDTSTTTRDEPNFNFDAFYAMSVRAGNTTRHLSLLQIQGFISNLRIPPGSTITSATLRLYLSDDLTTGYPRTVRLHRMLKPWTTDEENPTTWNNPDNAFGTDGVSLDDSEARAAASAEITLDQGVNRFVTANVTADLQAWVNGTANFGWVLLADNPDDTASFRTTNHARFNTETKPATAPSGTPANPILPLNKSYADLTDAEWRQVQSPTLVITYTPAAATMDTTLSDAAFFGSGDTNSDGTPDNAKLDYAGFSGLAEVKASALAGNYSAARTAFATYLRSRTQPVVPDPSDWTSVIASTPPTAGTTRLSPTTTAEKALILKFTADATTYTFPNGLPVDWEFSPNGASNFPQYMNRFSYCEDMAKAFSSTGNPVYLNGDAAASPRLYGLAEILRDWILGNPAPISNLNGGGLQAWTTMQAGLRAGHFWPRAWQRLVRSPVLPSDTLVLWAKSYYEHGKHLALYHASGNSLAMETNGLFMCSILFPEFRDSAAWRTEALVRLEEETGPLGQIYPEGAQTELTPLYHLTSLRHFANVIRAADANAVDVPAASDAPIEAMFEDVMKLCEPGLVLPDFNDSDQPNTGSVSGWMQLGYLLYPDREDFRYFATSRTAGTAPSETSLLLPYAGQLVMRSGWDAQARYLAFEGGPLGTSHYHDDKLGFVLNAYGQRLVIDSGRYAYDGSTYNAYSHSPNAHSVVHIGDYRQSRRLSSDVFRADTPYDIEWRTSAEFDYTTADFGTRAGEVFRNGTLSSSPTLAGASHRRHVLFVKGGNYWIIVDDIDQPDSTPRDLVAQFHLANGTTSVDAATQRVTMQITGGPSLTLTPMAEGGLAAGVIKGQTTPEILGWQMTGGTGTKTAIPVARFTRNASGRVQLATVLAPADAGSSAATPTVTRLATGDPNLFAVRVTWSDGRPTTDMIVNLAHGTPLSWAGQSYAPSAVVVQNGGSPYAWGQMVSIEADSATATEGQSHRPTFTVMRSGGDNAVPLTVSYTVSGSATTGSDYAALSGTVTIPAGSTSASFPVQILDDTLPELTESLSVTIQSGATFTANPTRGSATISMADNDVVTANGLAPTVTAGGSATGTIQINRPPGSGGSGVYSLTAASPVYTVLKTGQTGGPEYVWNDIPATGTAVAIWYDSSGSSGATTWPGTVADDKISGILSFTGGFTFPFYGETTTRLRISTNGFLTLGTASTAPDINIAYVNTNLPGAGGSQSYNKAPAAAIMPFWDDLYLDATASIHTRQLTDRYVIQFTKIRTYSNPNIRVTAQVVLHADGHIDYFYNAVPTTGVQYVVGIQNRARNQGLQVGTNAENAANVGSLTAVRFSPPVSWMSSSPSSLALAAGAQGQFTFTLNATGLAAGTYTSNVTVTSDDLGSVTIPVTFTVSAAAAPTALAATYTPAPDAVHLTWQDNATNETGYTVERQAGLDQAWSVVATLAANTTAFTDTTVLPRTGYTFRVKANHADGGSGYSNVATVWTAEELVLPSVTLTASAPSAAEAGAAGEFSFARTGDTSPPLTVHFAISGTATPGADYTALPTSITIPSGSPSATLAVNPLEDAIVEAGESVTLTLLEDAAYTIGASPAGTLTVADNDTFTATAPVLASAVPASDTSVTVTWMDSFDTNTRWRLRHSPNPDMSGATGFNLDDGTAAAHTFTGLTPGMTYYFQLRAEIISSATASQWSNTLSITPTALAAWRQQKFGTTSTAGNFADAADYDGDGVSNLLEYALAGDPASPSNAPTPAAQVANSKLQLTFPRARSDVTYTVQASNDLVTWTNLATNPGTIGQDVTVTDTLDLTANTRRFLRLKASAP